MLFSLPSSFRRDLKAEVIFKSGWHDCLTPLTRWLIHTWLGEISDERGWTEPEGLGSSLFSEGPDSGWRMWLAWPLGLKGFYVLEAMGPWSLTQRSLDVVPKTGEQKLEDSGG